MLILSLCCIHDLYLCQHGQRGLVKDISSLGRDPRSSPWRTCFGNKVKKLPKIIKCICSNRHLFFLFKYTKYTETCYNCRDILLKFQDATPLQEIPFNARNSFQRGEQGMNLQRYITYVKSQDATPLQEFSTQGIPFNGGKQGMIQTPRINKKTHLLQSQNKAMQLIVIESPTVINQKVGW